MHIYIYIHMYTNATVYFHKELSIRIKETKKKLYSDHVFSAEIHGTAITGEMKTIKTRT